MKDREGTDSAASLRMAKDSGAGPMVDADGRRRHGSKSGGACG